MADVVNIESDACAAAYRELRARVSELVRSADPGALDAIAPATPEWRVRDVLAHVSGVNTDIVNGNLNGVASDAWTDAQVATRRDWPVEQILEEWEANGSAVEADAAMLGSAAGQWVYDACTHEHDIRNALGAPGARDSDAVAIAFEWGTDRLGDILDGEAAIGIVLDTEAGSRTVGTVEPRATVRVSRFEAIRAMTGRRSVAQMEAYGWADEPLPVCLPLRPMFTPRAADFVE
jgi:uncharacterized protein (TIGR03083 family)